VDVVDPAACPCERFEEELGGVVDLADAPGCVSPAVLACFFGGGWVESVQCV